MADDWQPVTGAEGKVLGWLAEPDPDEPDVDYFEADRLPRVRRRAEILGQAADMFADDVFDPAETWDAGSAAGLTDFDLDAAAHIVVTLGEFEARRYPEL